MADLQSTNRVAIARVRETTFATTPANPVFKALRQTSSGLNANPQTIISSEIRSDRQVTDLILVGQQAQGDVGGELSFQAYDDDIEEALQSTWVTKPVITVVTLDTEISDLTATTFTVSAGGAAFVTGHMIYTTGFTTPANNGIIRRVVSSTATTIVTGAASYTLEASPIPVGATVRVVGFQGVSGDITTTTASGNAILATTLNFTTLGLVVGEWIKVGGATAGEQFATTALNGWCRISAIAAGRLSLDRAPTGWAIDAGATKTITVYIGDRLRNASTKRSNTFERQYLDHSPVTYEYLTGMTLNRFNLSMASQQIATLTRSYMGSAGSTTTTRVAGATDVLAPTFDVYDTSNDVGRVGFDGAILAGPNFVLSATIDINNNIRMQNAIGSIGSVGTGNGEFSVTGTLRTYFGDKSVLDKILANSATSFDTRFSSLTTGTGIRTALVFDMPTIKFASGSPSVQGKNNDVTIDGNYQAIMDPVLLYTIHVGRYWFAN